MKWKLSHITMRHNWQHHTVQGGKKAIFHIILPLLLLQMFFPSSALLSHSPLRIRDPHFEGVARIAQKRVRPLSPLDILRFSLGYAHTSSGSLALFDASRLIIDTASASDKKGLWENLPYEHKEQIAHLLSKAARLLLGDVERDMTRANADIPEDTWQLYFRITEGLANRSLEGFRARSSRALLQLDPSSVDLSRAVQLEYGSASSYSLHEVALDIIACDVLCRREALPKEECRSRSNISFVVDTINSILFDDLRIRFPPKQSSEKYIDRFSSIEEVLTSKRGVCLGVSAMYIALLQRLGVECNIYTPPGHIFISVPFDSAETPASDISERVIETTARGVHLPLSRYLDSRTAFVPKQHLRDVVGMVLMNDASRHIRNKQFEEAYALYKRARRYFVEDHPDLFSFMAFTALMTDRNDEAYSLAQKALSCPKPWSFDGDPLAYDISHNLLSKEQGLLLVQSMSPICSESPESQLQLIQKTLDSLSVERQPITMLALKADLMARTLHSQGIAASLEAIYARWEKASSEHKKAQFMGLPFFISLIEAHILRSDYPRAAQYAAQAIQYFNEELLLYTKSRRSMPEEMKEIIISLSKKSPGCLDGCYH